MINPYPPLRDSDTRSFFLDMSRAFAFEILIRAHFVSMTEPSVVLATVVDEKICKPWGELCNTILSFLDLYEMHSSNQVSNLSQVIFLSSFCTRMHLHFYHLRRSSLTSIFENPSHRFGTTPDFSVICYCAAHVLEYAIIVSLVPLNFAKESTGRLHRETRDLCQWVFRESRDADILRSPRSLESLL